MGGVRARPTVARNRLDLGRGDGKWSVCPDFLGSDSITYSFGVGDNVSFDLDLIATLGAEVHAFDPTPLAIDWIRRQVLPPQFHFHALGIAGYDGMADFALPESHSVSFTMLETPRGKMSARGAVRRLPTILDMLGHERVHLIKLDVEGAEYAVIPDLVALAHRIDQVLIEFHERLVHETNPEELTRTSIGRLEDAGFQLFSISSRGLEYSFIRDGPA